MIPLTFKTAVLIILCVLLAVSLQEKAPVARNSTQATDLPIIQVQTDDGLDPITLIFTGYAPSWWVASNIAGWGDSAYCSEPKTVNGNEYNYTLEHPDPNGIPCFGPRDHVRIWEMGYSPVFGEWSIGSAHHEHTVCNPNCHHVVDSWEKAEADVGSSFVNGQATLSISNHTLGNAGYYQGVFNDGNATMIQLKPPTAQYPVVFNEKGLSNETSWSVTVNGTTLSSQRPDITFFKPNGTYLFTVGAPQGYAVSPSSGAITVRGKSASQIILFSAPWSTSSATVYSTAGSPTLVSFSGNATVAIPSVHLTTSGNTAFHFTATEIGTLGVLNVTIPKSAVPSGSSVVVYVDGIRNNTTKIDDDTSHYYVYFFVPYGTHSVELQFTPQGNLYLEYVIGGALAAGILIALFTIVKLKRPRSNS